MARVQCKICQDILDGKDQRRHDMDFCSCGKVGLDDTADYCRLSGNVNDIIWLEEAKLMENEVAKSDAADKYVKAVDELLRSIRAYCSSYVIYSSLAHTDSEKVIEMIDLFSKDYPR